MSQDGLVAYFCNRGTEGEIFAYLPHVPGLNPHLLRIGDTLEGDVVTRGSRLELVEAYAQKERRRAAR